MTRKTALAFGIGASLILAAGAASADCATEIQTLQQQIGASETGTAANPTYSSNDPGEPATHDEQITGSTDATGSSETMTSDSSSSTTMDSGDAATGTAESGTAANPTYSSNDPGEPAEHDQQAIPGTTSSDVAGDTSGETMPSGTVGTGTVTETARSGELSVTDENRAAALTSLEQAQLHADAGDEAACMSELSIAKQHLGVE